MARVLDNATTSDADDHGLQFVNEEWNESISNGQQFTVGWNRSLNGEAAELNVYSVTFPEDGMVKYEFSQNLTDMIDDNSLTWTPHHLGDGLYSMWLTTGDEAHPENWTISPPWKAVPTSHSFQWAAPIGIPLVAIIGLYAAGVMTCLMYRRRKKAREKDKKQHQSVERDAERNGSISSATTLRALEALDDGEGNIKPGVYILTNSKIDIPELPEFPERARKSSTATSSTASSATLLGDQGSEVAPSPKYKKSIQYGLAI